MDYQKKYFKYKTKYFNLKAQIGGKNVINIISNNERFKITTKILNDKKIYIFKDNITKKIIALQKIKDKICIIDEFDGDYYFYLMKINTDNGDILSPNNELHCVKKQIEDILKSTFTIGRKIINIKLDVKNITLVRFNNITNMSNIDLSEAQREIVKLNIQLQSKCKNLEIKFDFMYNLTNSVDSWASGDYNILTLCLYNDANCISSIQLLHPLNDISNVSVLSKTSPEYEGKKYNKILRAILIIISKFIKYNGISEIIKTIHSSATNPISAWLFINSFNAQTHDEKFNEFIKDKVLSLDLIKEYFKINPEFSKLDTYIEVNNINIAKANQIFNLLLNEEDPIKMLKC